MDTQRLIRKSDFEWWIPPEARMRVPGVIFGTEDLVTNMDDKVFEQVANVATLPGIVKASFAMPDAHWGYGFPIGGVAAVDPEQDGVISAGGVGFDVSCGVRCLHTGLKQWEVAPVKEKLADILFAAIPAGLGSRGQIRLTNAEMDEMLLGGAQWAVEYGYGEPEDLARIEEHGCMAGAVPDDVSRQAKDRQRDEVGTLGSGNHYLEMQQVWEICEPEIAKVFGLEAGDVVISIHCGSRGLGHQIGTDYLKEMAIAAAKLHIELPDRELACVPILSPLGQRYLGAMRAAINCALANREVITHLARQAFAKVLPQARLSLLYDVSHNTCKLEEHVVDGVTRRLFVHRKGATRAFGPGHPELPRVFQTSGQPVFIGGSMGTESYILAGTTEAEQLSFSSSCHGAGRRMSRHQAFKQWHGRELVKELAAQGILIRTPSFRGVAEEAPGAYKDVGVVVDAANAVGLSRKVACLKPLVCIKG